MNINEEYPVTDPQLAGTITQDAIANIFTSLGWENNEDPIKKKIALVLAHDEQYQIAMENCEYELCNRHVKELVLMCVYLLFDLSDVEKFRDDYKNEVYNIST